MTRPTSQRWNHDRSAYSFQREDRANRFIPFVGDEPRLAQVLAELAILCIGFAAFVLMMLIAFGV